MLTLFLAKVVKLPFQMLLLKNQKGEGGKKDEVKYNWLVLGVNFGSVNIFDFRVELNWVILANYIRYFSSLLYYCAFIYCYCWIYVCAHCVLEPSSRPHCSWCHIARKTVPALESLIIHWFWWCAFSLQQMRLRYFSPTLIF